MSAISLVLVACLATAAWAAWAAGSTGSGQVTSVPDFRAPTVPASVIAGGSTGVVRPAASYTVYAQVSDAGTPASGIAGATANVTALTTGASAVALPSCSSGCVVDGVTYTHKSASLTADSPLSAGSKTYSVSTADVAGNARTVGGFTVTVDNSLSVSITSTPASVTKQTSATFTFTGSGTGFKCKLDAGSYATCPSGIAYSGLSQATHTFSVVATSSGFSDSAPATYTWIVDTTNPTAALTFPGAGPYGATTWNAGCSSAVCGTASDSGGSGVASVTVGIQRTSTGLWWNGSAFAAASEVLNTATGTGSWSLPLAASSLTEGSYLVRARANDAATNTSSIVSTTFSYDGTAPTVTALTFNGAGTVGKPEEGETLVLTFSEALAQTSICSSWATDSSIKALGGAITITIRNVSGANDVLIVGGGTCGTGQTFHFGSVDLGSAGYNNGSDDLVFGLGSGSNNAAVTWNPGTLQLTVKLGKLAGGTQCTTCPASSTATYTADGALKDVAGNAVSGTGSFTGRLF